MRPGVLALSGLLWLTATAAGCERVLGIEDPTLIGGSGDLGDGGFTDSERDGQVEPQTDGGTLTGDCNPVTQNCPGSDACYINLSTQSTFCEMVPEGSIGLQQEFPCASPGPEQMCFDDGCDKGFAPFLISEPGASLPPDRCAFLCSPVNTHDGNPEFASGDPAGVTCNSTFGDVRPPGPGPEYQCRFINSFYPGFGAVPRELGMCVSAELWGDCRSCNLADPITCSPGCLEAGPDV